MGSGKLAEHGMLLADAAVAGDVAENSNRSDTADGSSHSSSTIIISS